MSKQYSQEFKQNIIDLYQSNLKSARELAKEYNVGYSTIRKWLNIAAADKASGVSSEEVKVQAKRIKQLEEENVILKKALGLLAKN